MTGDGTTQVLFCKPPLKTEEVIDRESGTLTRGVG